eukprot:scaffold15298_cov16-Tisochrysis_lutea.AAC.1
MSVSTPQDSENCLQTSCPRPRQTNEHLSGMNEAQLYSDPHPYCSPNMGLGNYFRLSVMIEMSKLEGVPCRCKGGTLRQQG